MTNLAITYVPASGQVADQYASGMSTTRRRKPPRLMGAAEAAACLGVAQQNLRPIPGLPAPIQTLRCGSIYLADEIEAFAERRKWGTLAQPVSSSSR